VSDAEAARFAVRAEEFLAVAAGCVESGRFNAAAFNAAQSMMNANDALTIFHLGKRASADHREALLLHLDVVRLLNDGSQRARLKAALDLRSSAGYHGLPIPKGEAEKVVRHAAEFAIWVKRNLK